MARGSRARPGHPRQSASSPLPNRSGRHARNPVRLREATGCLRTNANSAGGEGLAAGGSTTRPIPSRPSRQWPSQGQMVPGSGPPSSRTPDRRVRMESPKEAMRRRTKGRAARRAGAAAPRPGRPTPGRDRSRIRIRASHPAPAKKRAPRGSAGRGVGGAVLGGNGRWCRPTAHRCSPASAPDAAANRRGLVRCVPCRQECVSAPVSPVDILRRSPGFHLPNMDEGERANVGWYPAR